jgi:hypothetical protein
VLDALAEFPTVKVAATAFAFWTTGVPAVALVDRDLMTTLVPFRLRAPVLLAPKVMAFSEPAVLLRAPALPRRSVPALIVTPPVKVLLPESVRVAGPAYVRPEPPLMLPLIVVLRRVLRSSAEKSRLELPVVVKV